MNVSEGLPCGFSQQAVLINPEETSYVILGDVQRTVVVTPDVEGTFQPTNATKKGPSLNRPFVTSSATV